MRIPRPEGVNATKILQVAPAARVATQVEEPSMEKSAALAPVVVMEENVRLDPVELVTLTWVRPLVLPEMRLPKSTSVGLKVRAALPDVPLPTSTMDCGEPAALSVNCRVL